MSVLGATILDVVITAILLISGTLSWVRGFAEELVTLLCWALALFVGIQFAEFGAQFIPESWDTVSIGGRHYGLSEFHTLFAGFVLVLITFILASQLHRLLDPLMQNNIMRRGNRAIGFVFGLVRGSVVVLMLVLILGTTTVPQSGFWQESQLIPYFVGAAQHIIDWMPESWHHYFHYPAATAV